MLAFTRNAGAWRVYRAGTSRAQPHDVPPEEIG
jgi:hypothetical protein